MNKFLLVCILPFFSCIDNVPEKREIAVPQYSSVIIGSNPCDEYNVLNDKIRDGLIGKEEALAQIQSLLSQIKTVFNQKGGQPFEKSQLVFPVEGYESNTIGGENGSGYVASGYNYFDGNKHGGHPAHDIFIFDKDQDSVDDYTKKPVNVLSMTGGIVIATAQTWDPTSNLRGGKYIWIYDPTSNSLFYYAHNDNVLVQQCEIVMPGDTIATVGRTGLNAFKKRSPTHLHIMQLMLDEQNYPRPIDCYKSLLSAKTK